jgi:allophanate hydrolase subunit 2
VVREDLAHKGNMVVAVVAAGAAQVSEMMRFVAGEGQVQAVGVVAAEVRAALEVQGGGEAAPAMASISTIMAPVVRWWIVTSRPAVPVREEEAVQVD